MSRSEPSTRMPLFRFSLRTAFVAFTIVCLCCGWYFERVYRQRELIASLGGRAEAEKYVIYDFQEEYARTSASSPKLEPVSPLDSYPRWLVELLSEDAFIRVIVIFPPATIDDRIVNAICRVRTLKMIRFLDDCVTKRQFDRIMRAHPNIVLLNSLPIAVLPE